MSVCIFVPSDQAGTSSNDENLEQEEGGEKMMVDNLQHNLQQFWTKVTDDVLKLTADDFKSQALPLARIKKIMKLDDEVKMISSEAPVLFAKAAEIFIHELTLRAWSHTEDNKRRTLQRNDIAMAISKSDQFDFLIDIVPRSEVKVSRPREEPPPRATHTTEQVVQAPLVGQALQQQFVIQPCAQFLQQSSASPAVMQQVVNTAGEVQGLPVQLTQAQLNMIRLQLQQNPNQPIIIQAAQQPQSPQIIQVQSQSQHQPQQQVYLAQVATTQDDS